MACDTPSNYGHPETPLWTHDLLTQVAASEVQGPRMSRSSIHRTLASHALRPHHVQGWLHSKDPEFKENYLDERQRDRATRRAVARLQAMGYKVDLQPATDDNRRRNGSLATPPERYGPWRGPAGGCLWRPRPGLRDPTVSADPYGDPPSARVSLGRSRTPTALWGRFSWECSPPGADAQVSAKSWATSPVMPGNRGQPSCWSAFSVTGSP